MRLGTNATTGRQRGDPTPEEIREFCRAFQARWSPPERLRRSGLSDVDVTLLYLRAEHDRRDHPTRVYSFGVLDGCE